MTEDIQNYQAVGLAFLFAAPRLLIIMTLIPFLGRTTLPGLVRNGVTLSLVLILLPMMLPDVEQTELGTMLMFLILLKEAIIGLIIGFALSIIFHAVEAVGFYIDNQRGSAMASSIDPLLGGQTSPMGLLLTQAFVTYFLVSGGFIALLGLIFGSYVVLPVFEFFPQLPSDGFRFATAQVDRLAYLTFTLAMPVFATMFIAEIGVALVSRFAPQMNVFVLAMPIKSAMAFLALVLYVHILFDVLGGLVFDAPQVFQEALQVL